MTETFKVSLIIIYLAHFSERVNVIALQSLYF